MTGFRLACMRQWANAACFAFLISLCAPAHALDPATRLQDYNHASWTVKDGAPADIRGMAQTPDGWLWLGASSGLYRFDGVRFERYPLPADGDLAKRRIHELVVRPNGDLWISYMMGGLSVLHRDGSVEHVMSSTSNIGGISTVVFDDTGTLWAATVRGVYRRDQGRWTLIGPEYGLHAVPANSMLYDQHGRIWVLCDTALYLRPHGATRFERVADGAEAGSLIQSPDGRIWVAARDKIRLAPSGDSGDAPRPAYFNQAESRWGGQFDRDGNLWAPRCPQGVCVVARAGARQSPLVTPSIEASDRLDQHWQLSSLAANSILEDLAGDIWIATQAGLDRFRENRLIPVRIPEATGGITMASDTEGGVWAAVAGTSSAWRLSATSEPVADSRQPFQAVANDRDGALLLAGRRIIERRYKGAVSRIALPPRRDGKPADLKVAGLLDDGKVLWMASAETGLMGYIDGGWLPRAAFNLPKLIFLSAAGTGKGQLWLACANARIVFYDDGKLTEYDSRLIGLATAIFAGPDILAAGDEGLAVLQGDRFRKLTAADPEVLTNISGLSVTPDGDHWFNGGKGLVHVRAADWRNAIDHAGTPLRYDLLDALDGYNGEAMLENRQHSLFTAPDGQLWLMTTSGVARMDPRRRGRAAFAPATAILAIDTATASYAAAAGLRLPPGAQSFGIRFTAPNLDRPEATRFQYQLSGEDNGWQDARGQREALYNKVAPGAHVFRVRTVNEDGGAGPAEAALAFDIAPTVMQTLWFKALCVLAAAGALYLLYWIRVRIAIERVAERMHVRMAERERIARTLHDTFLQSVQALLLRLDVVVARLPEDSEARRKLAPILDSVNDTIEEGRDQVHELRSGRVDDVERAARDAGRQLEAEHPGTRFSLVVRGTRIRLHSQVAEEACEIGREAMRNAFRHGAGDMVEVWLIYEREQFQLRVRDNGKGMHPRDGDKQRHYGLTGMRERAARAGGKLEIDSTPAGTRVTLSVPARLAYPEGGRGWWPLRLLSSGRV